MRKLKLKGSNQKETRKLYIQYYRNNYVKDKNGNDVIIKTKDGIRVLFYDEKDVHAYTISIPISYRKKERCFDFGRARRLNWIKEVIEESCKEPVYKKDFYDKRKKIWFRHYFVPEIKYYLLLKKNKRGDLVFKTHYVLDTYKGYLKKVKFFKYTE